MSTCLAESVYESSEDLATIEEECEVEEAEDLVTSEKHEFDWEEEQEEDLVTKRSMWLTKRRTRSRNAQKEIGPALRGQALRLIDRVV